MTTQQEALYWAETGTEILFSEGDPFKGKVPKDSLVQGLYQRVLRKLVEEDTPDLEEEEFQEVIEQIKSALKN
jgi:thioredoxin-like negative regulator of GroEL